MIIDGKVIYSRAGWVTARFDGSCALCGQDTRTGDAVIRVSASAMGSNFAGTCCAVEAEEASGHWLLRPRAPRKSS